MLRTKDILDEKDPRVRAKNTEVEFPLCEEYKSIIPEMLKHLRYSQIEKYSKKYNLRPGMGLAAPQLGINKRFFVVCYEVSDGKFEDYVLINPKVISYSEELIYAGEGEGCLSVNREVDGIVPRHARITVEGYDLEGNLIKYNSVEEGLEVAAKTLHNKYLTKGGVFYYGKTLSAVKTKFCPASSTWVNLVYGRMKQIIK